MVCAHVLRKHITSILLTLLLVGVVPVRAQDTSWFDALISGAAAFINNYLIPLFMVIAVAVFVWGVVIFIQHADDERQRADGQRRIVWGIVGLFVIVTVWGIVALISTIFDIQPKTGIERPGFCIPPQCP